jgi:hypothetical protein
VTGQTLSEATGGYRPKAEEHDQPYQECGLTPIRLRTCDAWGTQSQLIETTTSMAYSSRTPVACYTDRKWQIRFIYGSA